MGQTAGQRGNKESAANQESTDSQQDTEVAQPFADVDLLFESDKTRAETTCVCTAIICRLYSRA